MEVLTSLEGEVGGRPESDRKPSVVIRIVFIQYSSIIIVVNVCLILVIYYKRQSI